MAETFKKLAQGVLTTSITTLYTAPAATQTIISELVLANTTGGAVTAKLFQDGATDANCILPTTSISANTAYSYQGSKLVDAAGTIRGIGGAASSITYTIYGMEIT